MRPLSSRKFVFQISSGLLIVALGVLTKIPFQTSLLVLAFVLFGTTKIHRTAAVPLLFFGAYVFISSVIAQARGQDEFYIVNEARILLLLLIVSISSFRRSATITRFFNLEGLGILPLIILLAAGLTRGFGGVFMPIYFGVIAAILFWSWFLKYRGVPGLFFGSGTVAVASIAAANLLLVIRMKKSMLFAVAIILIGAIATVYFQVAFRNRSLVLIEIDRIQLFLMYFSVMSEAELTEILFGFGAGFNFWNVIEGDQYAIQAWLRGSSGVHGFYSYLFHSDHYRLILNYGIVFWFLIQAYLFHFLSREMFVFLFVAGFFNAVLLTPAVMLAILIKDYLTFSRLQFPERSPRARDRKISGPLGTSRYKT